MHLMPERSRRKLSARLVQRLEAEDPGRPVDVVVELVPVDVPTEGTRRERTAAMKETFERDLASVAERIEAAGGEVLESAWINQTVRSRIPAGQVPEVAEADAVSRVDLPTTLEPDVSGEPRPSSGEPEAPAAS
jgi:hypothetical protein